MDILKIPVEDLININDEFLFEYLSENRNLYTKKELKTIADSIKVYYSSSDTNGDIINTILYKISVKQVNQYLNNEKEIHYKNLNKVKEFTPQEKILFIKNYGKYLESNDIKSLIYEETNSYPPSYTEMLKDIYLSIQEGFIKESLK